MVAPLLLPRLCCRKVDAMCALPLMMMIQIIAEISGRSSNPNGEAKLVTHIHHVQPVADARSAHVLHLRVWSAQPVLFAMCVCLCIAIAVLLLGRKRNVLLVWPSLTVLSMLLFFSAAVTRRQWMVCLLSTPRVLGPFHWCWIRPTSVLTCLTISPGALLLALAPCDAVLCVWLCETALCDERNACPRVG